MNTKRLLSVLFLCLIVLPICAQKTKKVCGEINYVVPETQTLAEAKRTALNQARLKAIADEFGTTVSQTNTMSMHNNAGQSSPTFNSFTENDVRGIWIEDTKEPILTMDCNDNMLVLHAKVCGKARELKSKPVELLIETISYGSHDDRPNPFRPGYVTTEFNNNEFFGVRFKSPINGYVALFIRDDINDMVYTQMPYEGSDGYAREVKCNQEYTFLNNKDPEYERAYNQSVILQTNRKIETNTLIVVFSKNPFHMSLSNQGAFFPEIEMPNFQKWLHSLRSHDETIQVQEIVLTIKQ